MPIFHKSIWQKKAARYIKSCIGCASDFAQRGANFALSSVDQLTLNDKMQIYHENRKIVMKWIKKKGFPFIRPEGAFYIFPDISSYLKSNNLDIEEFAKNCREKAKVAISPGTQYGDYPNHIRICYAVKTQELETALRQLDSLF